MYIVQCNNKAYYVGSTDDLKDRVKKHNLGQGAEYTKRYRPTKLVYFEECATRAEAEKRERQIKGWCRAKKEKLIKGEWIQV
ncbi:GIY-YIG nuclease family protein [Patescibacteria group bacterium]|nr:GIY-YIG nuclease family protein [Patescibacteria group bacterium]